MFEIFWYTAVEIIPFEENYPFKECLTCCSNLTMLLESTAVRAKKYWKIVENNTSRRKEQQITGIFQ